MLSRAGVDFLQGATTGSGIIVGLVQQVIVTAVPSLPEQILLVRFLPEAAVPQMLYVLFLNLSFKLPHTASILSPEVVFHIEGDSHVGGLPLYVELVTRFQAVKRVGDQERRKQRNQNEKQYW